MKFSEMKIGLDAERTPAEKTLTRLLIGVSRFTDAFFFSVGIFMLWNASDTVLKTAGLCAVAWALIGIIFGDARYGRPERR